MESLGFMVSGDGPHSLGRASCFLGGFRGLALFILGVLMSLQVGARPARVGDSPSNIEVPEFIDAAGAPLSLDLIASDPRFAAWNVQAESFDPQTLNLDDFEGRLVVLDFFAHWCGPCYESLDHLKLVIDRYPQKVAVLVINEDPKGIPQNGEDPLRKILVSQTPQGKILANFPVFRRPQFPDGHFYEVDAYPRTILLKQNNDGVWNVIFSEYGDTLETGRGHLGNTIIAMIEEDNFDLTALKTPLQRQVEALEKKHKPEYDLVFDIYKPIRNTGDRETLIPLLEDLIAISLRWLQEAPGDDFGDPLERLLKNSVRRLRQSISAQESRRLLARLKEQLQFLQNSEKSYGHPASFNSALWGQVAKSDSDARLGPIGLWLADLAMSHNTGENFHPGLADTAARIYGNAGLFAKAKAAQSRALRHLLTQVESTYPDSSEEPVDLRKVESHRRKVAHYQWLLTEAENP